MCQQIMFKCNHCTTFVRSSDGTASSISSCNDRNINGMIMQTHDGPSCSVPRISITCFCFLNFSRNVASTARLSPPSSPNMFLFERFTATISPVTLSMAFTTIPYYGWKRKKNLNSRSRKKIYWP